MNQGSPQKTQELNVNSSPITSSFPESQTDNNITTSMETVFTHPLFKHEKDPILSSIINVIRCIIAKSSEGNFLKMHNSRWLGLLIKTIFANRKLPSLKQELKSLGLSFDATCGKMIGNNEIYFRCLDCDKYKEGSSNMHALLCSQCFESSNHDHHRVIMVKKEQNCSATCDCGDKSALDPNGFCINHKPKEFCAQETLLQFPADFLEKCLDTLKIAFYAVTCIYEISHAICDEKIKNALSGLAQSTLEATLTFGGICYNEINEAFLIVFGELFKSNFLPEKDLVWHFCEDSTACKGIRGIDSTTAHACTCSLVGNLLRISNLPNHEAQIKLQRILIECAKEPSFKNFLAQEFTKFLPFLYSETFSGNHPEDIFNSKLLDMKIQLYGTEDLCLKVLESGQFNNLINVMKKVILTSKHITQEMYYIVSDIRSSLISFINSHNTIAMSIIKDHTLLTELLHILKSFQTKTYYTEKFHIGLFDHQIDYHSLNISLMCEKVISQVLEQGFKAISFYPHEHKELIHHLAAEWYLCFEKMKDTHETKIKEGTSSFHPALERLLIFLMNALNKELSTENIHEFFTLTLPNVDITQLSERIIQGPLQSLGMIRYIHLEHNYNSGKIWNVYYFTNNLFFEMDIYAIQLMLSVMDPKHLFEQLLENFFSYNQDLQKFFQNPKTLIQGDDRFKQKIMVLEDFLHFMIFVMNDETCSFNIKISKSRESGSDETVLCPRDLEVIRKALTNVLLGHYWINVSEVKKIMKEILVNHSDIDKILQNIAIFDEKNKKVRIKEEYKNEFDPYIFYRNPSLQSLITQNIISKAPKGQPIDLVSGKYYSDLPHILKKIQTNIFESSFASYLALFVSSHQNHTTSLLRPVLKLILLNLQIFEELAGAEEAQKLLNIIQQTYLNKLFVDKLNKLAQIHELSDCESCIRQIIRLLKDISRKLSSTTSLFAEEKESTTKEDQIAMKKKLAQQRMLQLKEEFAKKQKTFADKNSLPQTQSPEKTSENKEDNNVKDEEGELRCQYCLDIINITTDIYGVPAYMSLTNNMYDAGNTESLFIKEDNPENLVGKWWPVFSSCMHHYHERCFQTHHKSTRKPPDALGKLFANDLETYCSLCNTVCNIFLRENEINENKMPDQEGKDKEPESQSHLMDGTSKYSFIKNINSLFEDFREKLRLHPQRDSKKEIPIPLEEIFNRGYIYLLEAFTFIDNPNNLEKKCQLIKLFIKECLSRIDQISQSNEDIIFNSSLLLNGSIDEKLLHFMHSDLEVILVDRTFKCLLKLSKTKSIIQNCDIIKEHSNILKEYIPIKMIQFLLLQNYSGHFTVENIHVFYQKNSQIRSDFLKALEFPLNKFALALSLNLAVLNPREKWHNHFLRASLNSKEEVNINLEILFKTNGCMKSLDEFILTSLQSLNIQSEDLIKAWNSILLHKTANIISIERPLTLKLVPKMIQLPKTYRDFTTKYLKKKCGQCEEYNQQMATYICLLCGELICLGYCETLKQRKGNLNTHAKQYHLGSSIYLEMQRLTIATVAFSKNSLSEGKNLYTDKLGQSFQDLIKDAQYPLYSLDFDKFTLNEDYFMNTMQIIKEADIPREAYRSTKASGFYYVEGNF